MIIFCDNQAVVHMVNNTSSGCCNCMYLLRLIVLNNLTYNRRITVRYIKSSDNILSDSLYRLRFDIFWKHAPVGTETKPYPVPNELWPINKFWIH